MQFEATLSEAVGEAARWPVPTLVMQASEDRLIMPCQVEALSQLLGVQPVRVPAVAHDIMLVRTSSGSCNADRDLLGLVFGLYAPTQEPLSLPCCFPVRKFHLLVIWRKRHGPTIIRMLA